MFSKVDDDALMAALSGLKAFAINLTGNATRAEDLVQETVLRAYANAGSFQPGTNMAAWLFVILRNLFRSEYRKRRREVEDADGIYEARLVAAYDQHKAVELQEMMSLIKRLPAEQREAITLVGLLGLSYEAAGKTMQCAEGTVKSRVNRARDRLAELAGEERTPIYTHGALRLEKRPAQRLAKLPEPRSVSPHGVVRRIPKTSQVWAHVQQRLKSPTIKEPKLVEVHSTTPQQTQQGNLEAFGTVFTLHKVITLPDGQVQKIYRAA